MDLQNNHEQRDLEREYLDFLDDEVSVFLSINLQIIWNTFLGRPKKIFRTCEKYDSRQEKQTCCKYKRFT